MLRGDGFLGTGASLGSDLSLVVQVIFFLALTVGVFMQRRGRYRAHDLIQTPVVILNFFFIIFIMLASFRQQEVARTLPQRPTDPYYLSAAAHGLLGFVAQALATYCLLAGHNILPRNIGRLRYVMWTTYLTWTAAFLFGVATYYVWYVRDGGQTAALNGAAPGQVGELAPIQAVPGGPTIHRVLLQQFAFSPQEITIVEGDSIVWINQDGAPHNIAFDDGRSVSDNFFQGQTFERTFDAPGTYEVFCSLHGNAGSGMHGLVRVLPRTDENVALAAAQPLPPPQPPRPTPAPQAPPAPLALIDPRQEDDVVAGLLAFRDQLAPADAAVLLLNGVAAPPSGFELHAWLTAASGPVLDMGPIAPDASGAVSFFYQDPNAQNLMALFDGVQVSLEPFGDDDPTPGEILYSGALPAAPIEHIRRITAQATTPNGLGYGVAARLQAEELVRHAQYVRLSLDLAAFADVQRHAEHLVNILSGEDGQHFGDLDNAFGLQNPGDGFGLIPYLQAMKESAAQAAAAAAATRAIQTHAEHVAIASDSALLSAQATLDAALALLQATNLDAMRPHVETIERHTQRLLVGEDENGDGTVALAEGGIFLAYQHAQYMGAVGLMQGAGAAIVDPLVGGAFGGETQLSGGGYIVHMIDFEFSPATLTIPAGATVVFINHGSGQHSATADDLSFDTGLLAPGASMAITFNEPGFYPYYCLLHGTRGNTGMAGSITVAPAAELQPATP